ncbi:hypothetical protein Apa02nite_042830 [Actinoplanes palleronii]|uniref:Uncharacterized protein n=1 Tax=Actinoplanes palleronii TaxID=113570 RepID=A0ABQ4BC65_9ACTN|nr:hypothetical protein Apa02nite_042830 [Actinoplanes palleronii]
MGPGMRQEPGRDLDRGSGRYRAVVAEQHPGAGRPVHDLPLRSAGAPEPAVHLRRCRAGTGRARDRLPFRTSGPSGRCGSFREADRDFRNLRPYGRALSVEAWLGDGEQDRRPVRWDG